MITKNLCIFADGNPLFLPLEKDGLGGGLKVAFSQEALQARNTDENQFAPVGAAVIEELIEHIFTTTELAA